MPTVYRVLNHVYVKYVIESIRTWLHVHQTTSISLQIINISRFLYFLTEDTILLQFQKKNEKGDMQKSTPIFQIGNHILY